MQLPNLPRLWDWILLALVLMGLIWLVAPQQIQVVAYKGALVALAVVMAYAADRALYARLSDRIQKGMRRDVMSAARLLSRALVFVAVVLGVTLGI